MLWDGYARLERQRGNIPAARAVYVTALQSAVSDPATEPNEDIIELWSAWAEMEWEEGEEVRCLEVLVMAAGLDTSRLGKLKTCSEYRDRSQEATIGVSADPSHLPTSPSSVALLKSRQVWSSP